MADLISDMNLAVVADSGKVINSFTLNVPMAMNYSTGVDTAIILGGATVVQSMSPDDADILQTIIGTLNNNINSLATYSRFTIDAGTNWSEWTKVS